MTSAPEPARRLRHNALGLFLRSIVAFYNFALGTVLLAAAGAPAYAFVAWAWPGLEAGHLLATGALRSGLLFLAYLVFGMTLLLVIVVVRNVLRLGAKEGTYSLSDPRLIGYFTYNVMIVAAKMFFLPVVRFSPVTVWFYRLMGARIGRHVMINTDHIYDLNLLSFGDHAVLGGSATIMAHVGQGSKLVIAPVRIGAQATIGAGAIVFPGADIGDGAVIGANSVVPRGFKVPPHTRWAGVPIRPVEDTGLA